MKRRIMQKRIITVLGVVLALAAIAGTFFCGVKFNEKRHEKEKPALDTVALAEELVEISELATMEYTYTNTVKYDSYLDFYGYRIPFTTNSFVISYDGSVKAGVDLSKAKISLEGELITISLPDARIVSHEIDFDSIQAMDETYSFFSKITITDYSSFTKDQNAAMEKKALDSGLLAKAKENAISVVRSFVASSNPGFTVVVI